MSSIDVLDPRTEDEIFGVHIEGADNALMKLYEPQHHQLPFHESNAPNLLALGTRGTGKSTTLRWDVIMRCLAFPGFKALIIRRKIPDLRKSHLQFINHECKMLGVAYYRETTFDVKFDNGSFIQFSHCEKMKDIENYLSSEWDYIGFDELSSFPLEMFLTISAAARSNTAKPYKALVRACSNPLGIGAAWMKEWFVDKTVNLAEYPDYLPDDFEMQFSTLDDNVYVNREEYTKRLRNLPAHVRKAWLDGEFVIEGAYFTDFEKARTIDGKRIPWHVVNAVPTWRDPSTNLPVPVTELSWLNIYRSLDWGYWPDPAVCHWHVMLPNKRRFTFMEKTWTRTLAADVAKEIKRLSDGMHVVETYCDPTMFVKDGGAKFSIGEQFEINGVPLTQSQNDRELYGYAVHEMMNTLVPDEQILVKGEPVATPSWQILEYACPELVRTMPILQMDKSDPRKIADGPDHWVVSCAYFGMGGAMPSRDPVSSPVKRWMRKKTAPRSYGRA